MEEEELQAFEIAALISAKVAGELDSDAEQKLEVWKAKSESNLRLYNELIDEQARERQLNLMSRYDKDAALTRINARIETPVISLRNPMWWRVAVAASVMLIISAGIFIYRNNILKQTIQFTHNDIPPGRNKAVLTLGDGRKINIDDHSYGAVAQQAGVSITKTSKGQLVYTVAQNATASVEYNTISTPNGGQYQVVLPDGTHVWLNAASSLRYPTRFNGSVREVTLTGEGYFEVVHNQRLPFIVDCGSQSVKVLGTHFNIHNYTGEPVVTTLLEGSVRLTAAANRAIVLKPGQRSVQQSTGFSVIPADSEQAVAWKEGQFIFHNTSLSTIMREVERWYNVQVDVATLPNEQYNGVISRNVPLSRLLEMLEATSSIKFKVSERRIMVQK